MRRLVVRLPRCAPAGRPGRRRQDGGGGTVPRRAACDRRPATALGEKERVIIQLGRDAIGKHKVDSETFAEAVKLFGHQGVVNIASLIGDYAATAILLSVADQHVRDVSLLPVP